MFSRIAAKSFFSKTVKTALAALTALSMVTVLTPTSASAEPHFQHNGYGHGHHYKRGFRGNGIHYRGHRGHHNRHYRGARHFNGGKRYYGGHRNYRKRNNGAAIAAGIIGLTAGAIIASEVKRNHRKKRVHRHVGSSYQPYTRGWYAACARKYRSFNPDTGRFLSYSGEYRVCRL